MTIENILFFIGGVSLFLFGMQVMGDALEKSAGNSLKTMLSRLTGNPITGFLLGAGVTAIIQSSSATTVMLVGFVNSGLMTLSGAIPIIMGANVGTTITSWILSLTGIEGDNLLMTMLKPVNFTAILAIIGVVLFVFMKSPKKKDIGMILLGFSVLIYGMDIMSDAVAPLKNVPEFVSLFEGLSNPILGVLVGAGVTAIIQSSSASVGILQSLALSTGAVTFGNAIPIIMGQNIGTCVTAMISSAGANKNAKRVRIVHLCFNIIGTVVLLTAFIIVKATVAPVAEFLEGPVDAAGIAIAHTAFNLVCTALLLPFGKQLEKLSYLIIRDGKEKEKNSRFDDRLLDTPTFAIDAVKKATYEMAEEAKASISCALGILRDKYTTANGETVRNFEERGDEFEDQIGSYLLKVTGRDLTEMDSHEVTKLLHSINDLERLTDHAVNLCESAEEMASKELSFSDEAIRELNVVLCATEEILSLAIEAYTTENLEKARRVEPLEEVIDELVSDVRLSHISRLKNNECTVELGFILNDVLTNLERISDHCSNIAGCLIEIANASLDMHGYTISLRDGDGEYTRLYEDYSVKYNLIISK